MYTKIEENSNILCDHGCGKIAKYTTTRGKLLCESNPCKCPSIKIKVSENTSGKLFENFDNKICNYGCDQLAKYIFPNGKVCCSANYNSCSFVKNNLYKPLNSDSKNLCDYGCGQIARFSFHKKICCSSNISSCPSIIKKNSKPKGHYKKSVLIENPSELCKYGCGQLATYMLQDKSVCCSSNPMLCKIMKELLSQPKKKASPIETSELCGYGCGNIAKFKLNSGKLCCSSKYQSCNNVRIKHNKDSSKFIKNTPEILTIKFENICEYGCGEIANFRFKNGKYCCSHNASNCKGTRSKTRISHKPIELIANIDKICEFGCGKLAKFELSFNKRLCCSNNQDLCENRSIVRNITLNKLRFKSPFIFKVEELRENPENENQIQGHCKNAMCKNSKERGGWFTLEDGQIMHRIYGAERGDLGYLYCSKDCRDNCPLHGYNPKYDSNRFINGTEIIHPYTQNDLNIWRKYSFKIQSDQDGFNYCELCLATDKLHAHHEVPKKTHPHMALDPINCIIVCEHCHKKLHKGDCSTGKLASLVCRLIINKSIAKAKELELKETINNSKGE